MNWLEFSLRTLALLFIFVGLIYCVREYLKRRKGKDLYNALSPNNAISEEFFLYILKRQEIGRPLVFIRLSENNWSVYGSMPWSKEETPCVEQS